MRKDEEAEEREGKRLTADHPLSYTEGISAQCSRATEHH